MVHVLNRYYAVKLSLKVRKENFEIVDFLHHERSLHWLVDHYYVVECGKMRMVVVV